MNIIQDASVKQLINSFDESASVALKKATMENNHLYDGYGPNGYEQCAGRFNVVISYKYSVDFEGKKNISRTISGGFCTITGTYPSVEFNIPSTVTVNNTL